MRVVATILPFPLARRRTMIVRQARYAAELSLDAAERHIAQQIKIQGDAMRRRGIDEARIEREHAMHGGVPFARSSPGLLREVHVEPATCDI